MSFYVTVTPTIQNVEVEVNPQTLPFEVEVVVNGDLKEYVDQAEAFADQAEASAISADNSADSALASATSATASANSASSSASSASSSASTATTQAGIATTKANEASQSASDALASEQASAISEANALASEQASAQSEANALSSEQNALASEQASALSASNALASENSASASASTATTQAGIATTQAGIATTQASNALASANAAAASAASAAQVGTSTLLTGFSVGSNTAIAGTDTILQAFNKTQGQINARVSGTGTSGQVSFWNGTTSQTGEAVFNYDTLNDVLGVGITNPLDFRYVTSSGITIGSTAQNGMMTLVASTSGSGIVSFADGTSGNDRLRGLILYNHPTETFRFHVNAVEVIRLSETRFGLLTVAPTQTLDVNGTGRIRNGVSLADTSGNVQIGTTTDAGFRLDVSGSTRLNGLQTFQGTTASDTAPLGSELATTGSGTNWTGTGFATGYTHTVGSTASLTTSIPAVNGTYYQIAYTITGRTAGSITINYGGTSTASITATGATGPLATSTANLEIVPTTDFDGTVVLSVRSIGTSSATTTINDSGGNSRIQIRATSSASNTLVGNNAGRRITTSTFNSFFGNNAGQNTTTGINNSFFGQGSGAGNTTGANNSFFGVGSGVSNTTGSSNSFFGTSAGQINTTGSSNSFFGLGSGQNNTTGSYNVFIGQDAGRRISGGGNLTVSTNSVFVGVDTRANADSETNQTVIGYQAIGLGSNTTVIGNSSTTFGRWWGNLLLGTSTNSGFLLDVNGTARVTGNLTTNLTATRIPFIGTGGVLSDDAGLTWDNTNKRLLIAQTNLGGQTTNLNLINLSTTSSTAVALKFTPSTDVNTQIGAAIKVIRTNSPSNGDCQMIFSVYSPISTVLNDYWRILSSGVLESIGTQTIQTSTGNLTIATNGGNGNIALLPNGTGGVGVGTSSPNAVAQLEVSSTTKGFLPPRMTTAQRDLIAAVAGLVIYNTTTNKHQGHNGTAWQDFY